MRVLHLMAGASQGGAEVFFERLVTGLHQKGLPQHLVIRGEEAREKRLRASGLSLSTAPFWKPYFDIKTHLGIHKALKNFQPDIVMSWMSRAGAFCPTGNFVTVARLGGYYDLKYYKSCEYLIGNTQGIRKYFLEKGIREDKAFYLPNFVREEKAQPLSRKTYDTPENVPLLLALGRLHDDKAFDVLIRALPKIPNAHLWIGGAGPEDEKLKSLAREMGVFDRIRFLGWVQDPYPLYAACDIYVCPSRIEPLGNVVLEAWVNEKPTVVCASKGPAELIRNEENGLIVPLEDHDELATAINRILNDKILSGKIVKGGLQSYHSAYSQDRVLEIYLNFFQHIIEERQKSCAA
ncbi:Glycosyltransferase [Candidatus Bealeia paramacronuclearis]|uniref:Glycosyltransferase n=2 Tax=Candidatus Bealeia paramacronuclearis TaxID=1921001 RepID=A0ABZ2C253_9PROT|nr:Glycosyltransferase [Candidatus Bealeia paramacronuclearis]